MKWNGLVADNIAHAAGASILSQLRACVVRAACAGPGGLPLGSATHFHNVAIATHPVHRLTPLSMTSRPKVITFRVSRRPREMYCGHARLCVCLCLSAAACPHYCTDPDVNWGSGRGCPLVVHYRADLQSVHGMRCYGNVVVEIPDTRRSLHLA